MKNRPIYAFAALLLLAVLLGTAPPGQVSAGDDKTTAEQVKKEIYPDLNQALPPHCRSSGEVA